MFRLDFCLLSICVVLLVSSGLLLIVCFFSFSVCLLVAFSSCFAACCVCLSVPVVCSAPFCIAGGIINRGIMPRLIIPVESF